MKAAIITGAKQFEIREIDRPVSVEGQAILKVSKCSICGSDYHYWAAGGDKCKDWILGHEFCGIVEDPGANPQLKKGMRAIALPSFACGDCVYCKSGHLNHCQTGKLTDAVGNGAPGAYAEYVMARWDATFPLPEQISDVEACMIEPAAVGYHSVRRGNIQEGEKVLIVGAGIIGLLTAMWCRFQGKASYIAIAETNPHRIALAKKYGFADGVFDTKDSSYVQNLLNVTDGLGFDKMFECVGNDSAVNFAMEIVKPDCDIIMSGVPLGHTSFNMNQFVIREMHMTGTHGYDVEDAMTCLQLLMEGKIDLKQFVTREIALEEVQATFEDLTSGHTKDVKVVIAL